MSRTLLVRVFACLLASGLLAACAKPDAPTQQADWRLIPANQAASGDHLIVTIELQDQETMTAQAATLEAAYPMQLVAEWPLKSISVHCLVFLADPGSDVSTLVAELEADGRVRTAQPMQSYAISAETYSDELFRLQDSLRAIKAPRTHSVTTGKNVRIGLVDTGVDRDHPDLSRQVLDARDFVGDGEPAGKERHGTAMAGIIAADARNGQGIVGVAPDAELHALRGCWEEDGSGRCSSFSLARALNFAILNDIDVLNLSLSGPPDPLLAELIEAAVAKGVTVVAAHSDDPERAFPASHAKVIAVSSMESNLGAASPQVSAPGMDVISTAPNAAYDYYSGSSVATAHVSGVAALVLERRPDLTPEEVRRALVEGARSPAGQTGQQGLDSCRALAASAGAAQAPTC